MDIEDNGPLLKTHGNVWAVLTDKGYVGMERKIRSISPKKKPVNRNPTFAEIDFNNNRATDHFLVEKFFGIMGTLWAMMGRKYRWSELKYDVIMRMCLALTNLHICKHPLRDEDGFSYRNLRRSLSHIEDETSERRQRQQKKYRDQRRSRICDDSDDAIFANEIRTP